MKPPKFHVGQAVVCIDGSGFPAGHRLSVPQLGKIYRVRDTYQCCENDCILLDEIINRAVTATCLSCRKSTRREPSFLAHRFAPVELLLDEALRVLQHCPELWASRRLARRPC